MTKQEIQALIDAQIAGQGSAVDVGGALPKILTEILNAAFAGANVQSDWNENDNTDPSFIKNKPTIPAAQVQSDWAQSDSEEVDYIKHKPIMPNIVSAKEFPSGWSQGIEIDSTLFEKLRAASIVRYDGNDLIRITAEKGMPFDVSYLGAVYPVSFFQFIQMEYSATDETEAELGMFARISVVMDTNEKYFMRYDEV